jgi:CheY-like chemotaxis protein
VESRPGQGTTFEIYIPRAEEVTLAISTATQKETRIMPKGTETILLVEDEEGIRALTSEYLCAQGYTVLHAMDGSEALRIADGHEDLIHLLVTDMVMPNLGGRELANRLRKVRPQIKVLFMSGYPEHPALSSEAVDRPEAILQKPFLLETLAHKVRGVLGQG